MAERDRLFKRHPKTTFIAAHMGWHANDLARLGKMFDEMPNVYGEVGRGPLRPRTPAADGARLLREVPGPRSCSARTAISPTSSRTSGGRSRPADEYFDYYRDYHAFWKLYGLALPDGVLRKLYYQNALKLVPGLPRAGFPQTDGLAADRGGRSSC